MAKPKITILGGGIAGVSLALKLADAGFEVEIYEQYSEILSGSSDNTPCRIGIGVHYFDLATAIKYLQCSINVLKQYPEYVVGHDLDQSHPYRHVVYFVMKDSIFPLEKIRELHEALRNEYIRLIALDEKNKVLGEPEDFSKEIDKHNFQHLINTDIVQTGFVTAEQTLDWPKLKADLIHRVNYHPNIRVYRNAEVLGISPGDKSTNYSRYKLRLRTKTSYGKEIIIERGAEILSNSTWENIDFLSQTAGFPMAPNSRTNRTKVMIEIQLPADFEQLGPVNSMFFCFGAHASFTNAGNGKGYITYEEVTNLKDENGVEQNSMGLVISNFTKRVLAGKATEEEKISYGNQILYGCLNEKNKTTAPGITHYIHKLKGAIILSAHFGIVRTFGAIKNLNDPNSPHHTRTDDGIKSRAVGFIEDPSMKFFYFDDGSNKAKTLIEEHVAVSEKIDGILSNATPTANNKLLGQVVKMNLDRILEPTHLPNHSMPTSYSRTIYKIITQIPAVLNQLLSHKNKKSVNSPSMVILAQKQLEPSKKQTMPTSFIWASKSEQVTTQQKTQQHSSVIWGTGNTHSAPRNSHLVKQSFFPSHSTSNKENESMSQRNTNTDFPTENRNQENQNNPTRTTQSTKAKVAYA